MGSKKRRVLKIAAGFIAILLIGAILFITNAFVGNPISAMLANKEIERYAKQHYSYLDLEFEKVGYNFKDGTYMVRAKSKRSIDTHFLIAYRQGEVVWDEYESVVNMFNTLERLSDEYSALVKRIIKKQLGYENQSYVMYSGEEYEQPNDVLELDMAFDQTLPLNAEVTLRLNVEERSMEGLANLLTDAHRALAKENCTFSQYHIFADDEETMVMVNGVTPADIESGKLVSLLNEAKEKENGRISVYIKE